MKYENKVLNGLFTYLENDGTDLGNYNVKFYPENGINVLKEFDFKRQYVNSLNETFIKNGVDQLFR